MTPKEKAKDLVDKHLKLCVEKDYHQDFKLIQVKRGALIAVDEILKSNPHSDPLSTDLGISLSLYDYWKEVKQEIEKL